MFFIFYVLFYSQEYPEKPFFYDVKADHRSIVNET